MRTRVETYRAVLLGVALVGCASDDDEIIGGNVSVQGNTIGGATGTSTRRDERIASGGSGQSDSTSNVGTELHGTGGISGGGATSAEGGAVGAGGGITGGSMTTGGRAISAGGSMSTGGIATVAGGSTSTGGIATVAGGSTSTGGIATIAGNSATGIGGSLPGSSSATGSSAADAGRSATGGAIGTGGAATGGTSSGATSTGGSSMGGATDGGDTAGGAPSTGGSATGGTTSTGGSESAPCDGFPSGFEQMREQYADSEVRAPSTCVSEQQRRTCSNGNWSDWSGTFSATACTICADSDGDHHGNGCLAGSDCDDASAACSSACVQVLTDGPDEDGDGAPGSLVEALRCPGTSHGRIDCDDTNSGISPRAAERPWDLVDDNCDGKLGPHLEPIGTLDCFAFEEVHATSDFVAACDGKNTSAGRMLIRRVSDLSHPYSPISHVPSCKFGIGGNVIVVADLATHELVVYRIPAAGEPLVETGRFAAPGDPDMVVSSTGDRVYLSEGNVVDFSDPAQPHAIGTVPFKFSNGEEVGRRLRTTYDIATPSTSGYIYSLQARVDDATDPAAIQPIHLGYFSASQGGYSLPKFWAKSSDRVLSGGDGLYYLSDVTTGSSSGIGGGSNESVNGAVQVEDTIWRESITWANQGRRLCSGSPPSSCSSFGFGNAAMDRAGSMLLLRTLSAIAVLDVSSGTPTIIGTWGTVPNNSDGEVAIADAKRLLTSGFDGLAVIDIDGNVVPRGGALLSSASSSALAVTQTRAIIAGADGWLESTDITNSAKPIVTAWIRSDRGVAAAVSRTDPLFVTAIADPSGDLWALRDANSLAPIGASLGAHPTDGVQNWAYGAGRSLVIEGSNAYSQYVEVNNHSRGLVVFTLGAGGLTPQRWFEVPDQSANAPGTMVARNGLITYVGNDVSTIDADTGVIVETYQRVSRLADDGRYTFLRDDNTTEGGLSVLTGSTLPRRQVPIQLPAGYANLRGPFAAGSDVIVTGLSTPTQPNACLAAMRIIDDGG